MGRPKEYNGKHYIYTIRLSAEEVKMLEEISEETGETKAEIIRDAIKNRRDLLDFS